jgi:polyphenol oxidase
MTAVQWLTADWPVPAGVVAGTTLRIGGASEGLYASLNLGAHVGDDPDAVRTNRRRFVEACRLPREPPWLRQVHGTRVMAAHSAAPAQPADAIVANRPGAVCAVLTADCLPVVFASSSGTEIAVAHAGWRGLSAGVLEATVAALAAPPRELLAWLGPAISQAAFEVGDEVREVFVQTDPDAAVHFRRNDRARWQADLYGLARFRLERCGVTRVFGGDRCTFGEPDAFFSYRRDGQCGRMATFAYLKSDGGRRRILRLKSAVSAQ